MCLGGSDFDTIGGGFFYVEVWRSAFVWMG